jgi:hypothetical protein
VNDIYVYEVSAGKALRTLAPLVVLISEQRMPALVLRMPFLASTNSASGVQ